MICTRRKERHFKRRWYQFVPWDLFGSGVAGKEMEEFDVKSMYTSTGFINGLECILLGSIRNKNINLPIILIRNKTKSWSDAV